MKQGMAEQKQGMAGEKNRKFAYNTDFRQPIKPVHGKDCAD